LATTLFAGAVGAGATRRLPGFRPRRFLLGMVFLQDKPKLAVGDRTTGRQQLPGYYGSANTSVKSRWQHFIVASAGRIL